MQLQRLQTPEFDGMADAIDGAEGRVRVLQHHVARLNLLVPKHFFPDGGLVRGEGQREGQREGGERGLADMLLIGCAGTPASFSSCTQCWARCCWKTACNTRCSSVLFATRCALVLKRESPGRCGRPRVRHRDKN